MMIDLSKIEKVKTLEDLQKEDESSEAVMYLRSTDWYVIRSLETGEAIPDKVKEQRAAARQKVITPEA